MIIDTADRTKTVSEYYFSIKLQEIDRMNQSGVKVINLGIGSPDRAPAEEVVSTLIREASDPGNHAYQSYKGIPELRNAFAEWYKEFYGVQLDAAQEIQLLAGSKEGILLLSLAFLNKGDQVLVPDPGYPTYMSASRLAEADVRTYDLREENGWIPDLETLEQTDLTKVKLMWVNYPHMPTGAAATPEIFRRLVAFGLKHRILICNDNPYSFILNDTPLSLLSAPRAKECCVELNSLSKSHNMAGWRVGMIGGNSEVIAQLLKVKSNMDSGMFRPVQLAAVEALRLQKEWHGELNREYAGRKRLAGELFDLLGIRYDPGSCGMFLWGRIPEDWESSESFCDRILYQARVFITPGSIFGANGKRYVRISLCADTGVLIEAYRRIQESLQIKQANRNQ